MKEGFDYLKELKEIIFKLRLKLCRKRKSKPWDMNDLEAVAILKTHFSPKKNHF